MGEVLDTWPAGKRGRATAMSRDEINIRVHLKPRVGHLRLDRLRVAHLTEAFAAITEANIEIADGNRQRRNAIAELARIPWKGIENRARRKLLKASIAAMPPIRHTVGAATRQRIRSTLRAALNDAVAQQLITFNPAAHVALDAGKRPKAVVWTEQRIEHWRRTSEKPSSVMVWTPQQTGRFLDHAEWDPLYALRHLIAYRGLRRGEACGQRRTDVHLDQGLLTVAKELVVDGWEVYEDDPKTNAGARTMALDDVTAAVLRRHLDRQEIARVEWGDGWVETGRVFTQEDGTWLHPANVSRRFVQLYEEVDLPPIRLHDLRHGAAGIAHAGGADLHAIKELLGHSTITLTSDTYTSLFPQVDKAIAEASALVVPWANRASTLDPNEAQATATDQHGDTGNQAQ